MSNENAAVSKFSFASPEWLKSFNVGPKNVHAATTKEALEFTASCLQDQAEYLKKLAECADPAEALKCQWDFAQQSWSRSLSEAWKIFDSLRRPSNSMST